ncbi:hypothetical protein C1J02_11990 [Sulfitobacter sp. SK011]|nr:hypothetical protein C1J02_11990 [Sulfitobacter sp. SK011]
MTEATCAKEGCTFADTGVCLQNFSPPQDCPELVSVSVVDSADIAENDDDIVELDSVAQSLPSGHVMNLSDLSVVTAKEYTRLVGILGSPNAGKTAALVSLYLMLANGKLDGFTFRDSKTLLALEEISRGARRWGNGVQPEQLTDHTRSLDDRQPGFVHLRLHRLEDQHTVTIALPDLPGEWTKSLVDENNFNRLSFLNACEKIWIVIDGRDFRDQLGRRVEVNRTELLLERLKQNLASPTKHEVILVITHADLGELAKGTLEPVLKFAERLGFRSAVHHIASFSSLDTIAPGSGVAELLASTLSDGSRSFPDIWPKRTVREGRHMMRFEKMDDPS